MDAKFWEDKYNQEVESSQEFYDWAMANIKHLESCSPEAFEYEMDVEKLEKIKLRSRILKDHKNDAIKIGAMM